MGAERLVKLMHDMQLFLQLRKRNLPVMEEQAFFRVEWVSYLGGLELHGQASVHGRVGQTLLKVRWHLISLDLMKN